MKIQQDAICKGIEIIENNLNRNITIDEIADAVGYSKAHYQRMFVYYTGQNIARYLFQRKITEAAKRLVESDEKIINLSFEFGFASHEAFSRAFKNYFHYTPFQFRKNGSLSPTKLKQEISRELIMKKTATKVDYLGDEFIPRFEIYGFACDSMNVKDIYKTWNRLNKTLTNSELDRYGIIEYGENSSELGFEYIAGINGKLKKYDKKVIVKENQYAVFKHVGSFNDISASFRYIYGKWANDSRLTIDFNYDFERYKKNGEGILIYIPTK